MRCMVFHLYRLDGEQVDYIMETFPMVKSKDELGVPCVSFPAPPEDVRQEGRGV